MGKTLKVYYTTDTHGYLFPTDYVSKEEKPMGVLSCINEFEKDENTLILDAGDTLQGSAFAKYLWENDRQGSVIADVFNAGKYDYFTLGNHDFNYGYDRIKRYLQDNNAKCLAANVIDSEKQLDIMPYVIHELENGLKVGIVGVVTDYVTLWEKPEHIEKIKIEDTFTAAKKALESIKDQCDLTICLYHGGYECDLETGERLAEGKENVGYRICEELTFDVLLTGHQHMETAGRWLNGTYTMQLPANAMKYGALVIDVDETGKLTITSEVKMPSQPFTAENAKVETKQDWFEKQEIVQKWLDSKLGSFTEAIPALSKLELGINGSRIADFGNQVQLEYTGADFSCVSLGNNPIGLGKDVTIREIMAAYQFPNMVKVLEVDEAILRQALERCAEYLTAEDGKIRISDCFIKPKQEHYNYDFFAGLSYTFDLSKPVGQRVVRLEVDGKPLGDKKYTLAMSDYRATGTGGYECYQKCELVKTYAIDIQEVIIEYIKKHKVVEIMNRPDFKVVV